MKNKKQIIEGPMIKIMVPMDRFKIVESVVSAFIEFEKDKKGKGTEFRYPVENLSSGGMLYIHRPGVKWNFDFKVEIPQACGIDEGRHDELGLILRRVKMTNQSEFEKLWQLITEIYKCRENNVDQLLSQTPVSIGTISWTDVLLKVIKWLFIMEDIIYWHYEGRAFLYNFFKYVANETDEERLHQVLSGIRERKIKPAKIKTLLEKIGLSWELP
ncbi:MAG: hypothetical protein QW620_08215 [Thermoplasmata archaeon]